MSVPFTNALQREQARQQRQREGGQQMDLSDRLQGLTPLPGSSPYSPVTVGSPAIGIGSPPVQFGSPGNVGVGTPDFDPEAFLATVRTLPTPPPLVASPAGQGTNILDYSNRDDVIKAVSTVAFLPAGRNRENLIRQFNITKREVQTARSAHNADLIRRGQPPVTVFPTIIWPRVTRGARPPSRRGPTRPLPVVTATVTAPATTATTTTAAPSTPRQQGMHDRLDQLTQQVHSDARGRRIRNITHTNTITTVYEEPQGGQRPTVRRTSTRTGAGRRTRRSRQSRV